MTTSLTPQAPTRRIGGGPDPVGGRRELDRARRAHAA